MADDVVIPAGQEVPNPDPTKPIMVASNAVIMAQLAQVGISAAAFQWLSPQTKIAALQAAGTTLLAMRDFSVHMAVIQNPPAAPTPPAGAA
jgi:hypothetical protein